ncbi:MAG: lytic transglycosylase domain-containing protein, partial [Deltaproteobacteria bacterium]|nr:lytic transglycosylase domain-containing protein [Deltaproteobacteria bacterium]
SMGAPTADPASRDALVRRMQSEHIPPTWEANARWDRESAWGRWKDLSKDFGEAWPDLPVAYELSRVGLGEIAGPMVNAIYIEIGKYRRSKRVRRDVAKWKASGGKSKDPDIERKAAAQDIKLRSRDWMAVFSGAGYPAQVSKFATDSIPFRSMGREDDDARRAWTLAYPAAFSPHVWRAGWEGGVDPLLMLSIMRAESAYRHDAVSPVGALGLVQVMPATGSKVAALGEFEGFRVERLLEASVNIEIGTWYMGQLLERFGPGHFPLAVGSYNGGPHNIGRWLKAKVGADLEDFVEEVAFDETRNYIKKVTRYYAIYADLYGGGAPVLLPGRTVTDDPTVINF